MKRALTLATCLAIIPVCSNGAGEPQWVTVSAGTYLLGSREEGAAHSPKKFTLNEFSIAATETTVDIFCAYLNAVQKSALANHPQIRQQDGRFTPQPEFRGHPVAFVSCAEAEAFCAWLGESIGSEVRLPTSPEWEAAARGGLAGGRYPWGWGSWDGMANFAGDEAAPVAHFDPNPLGLYDMAGNLFEWCRADETAQAPVRGGSWAEKDLRLMRVFHEVLIDRNYRGADVGFRVVRIGKEQWEHKK